MEGPIRLIRVGVIGVFLVVGVLAAAFFSTRLIRRPNLTPEIRGYELALDLGCFACHGPAGTGTIPNPGSEEKEVPSWDGGTAMMYVENEEEIREWILDGHPKRLSGKHEHHAERPDPFSLAYIEEEPEGDEGGEVEQEPLLEMPPFRDVISSGELENLVAYYKAVAKFDPIPAEHKSGYKVASQLGCFGCHGPGGLVGSSNPRSFKGYIPPWRGPDYREMVKSDEELEQWIKEGKIDRFESNPIASFFTNRQIIQMPAYEDRMTDQELTQLIGYIRWLQQTER